MADITTEARKRAQQIAADFLTNAISLSNVYEDCGPGMTDLAAYLRDTTFAHIDLESMRESAADAEAAFLVALAIGQVLAAGKVGAR